MTKEEFNKTVFMANMEFLCDGEWHNIVQVDFEFPRIIYNYGMIIAEYIEEVRLKNENL